VGRAAKSLQERIGDGDTRGHGVRKFREEVEALRNLDSLSHKFALRAATDLDDALMDIEAGRVELAALQARKRKPRDIRQRIAQLEKRIERRARDAERHERRLERHAKNVSTNPPAEPDLFELLSQPRGRRFTKFH